MPNCPNQSAHDVAPSTPQLPPVPGPDTIGRPSPIVLLPRHPGGPGWTSSWTPEDMFSPAVAPVPRLVSILLGAVTPSSALRATSNHTRFSSSEGRPRHSGRHPHPTKVHGHVDTQAS